MKIQSLLILFMASLLMTGCDACDDGDVNIPRQADPNGETFEAALTFGNSQYDNQIPGAGDPCEVFRTGDYPVRSVKVEVFVLDANGNEVIIFEQTYRDGVDPHFKDGNPNSLKIRVPEVGGGAYKVRTTVVGYFCDELPHPVFCLDCCEEGLPMWQRTSPWKESTGGWIYIDYPRFWDCF